MKQTKTFENLLCKLALVSSDRCSRLCRKV